MCKLFQRMVCFVWIMLLGLSVQAGSELTVVKVLDGRIGQVKKDSSILVNDARFFDQNLDTVLIKPYPVKNMVSLEINEDALLMLRTSFSVTTRLLITTTGANQTVHSFEKELTVNYDGSGKYGSRSTFLFENAYRVEVKIISIDSNVNTWPVCEVLKVVNQLQSFPRYYFSCSENAVKEIFSDPAYTPGTEADEVNIWWMPDIAADEYDVEWTFIDEDALLDSLYGPPNAPDLELIFANNASRVTVSASGYNIPLLYDGKGRLFFRVRSVQWMSGTNGDEGRLEADWSSDYSGGTGILSYLGHEKQLNWQSSISFAEDGKRKGVVQYYDGSLRSRQTVTKDNASNRTIVAESMYDYQGRPVIQTLPVPTLSNVVKYSRNFNRAVGKNDYDKSLYDTLTSGYCDQLGLAMDVTSGASRYYSPFNDSVNAASGIYKFIPDAEGYPFTELVYTQDGTGRISRQSGVGKDFRIGSGHETRFYYGAPTQEELNALFGTEAGYADHYLKNMVKDANGQFSVSYLDMRGRTIATALAGDSINAKLDALPSRNIQWITEKLNDPASTTISGLLMESNKAVVVATEGTHLFRYELNPASLEIEGCNLEKVCYDCLYDLVITITDDCNNQNLGGQPYSHTVRNFSLANIDTTCNEAGGILVSFSLNLLPGVYHINKRLMVSQSGMDFYRDSVYMTKNSCKSLDDFIKEQRQITIESTNDCEPSCAGCMEKVGTWEQYWQKYRTQLSIADADSSLFRNEAQLAWSTAIAECKQLCEGSNLLLDLRNAMLADLTPPSGQYANIADTAGVYSIFRMQAAAPYTQLQGYRDETGKPDSIFTSANIAVPPQSAGWKDFIDNFRKSWAETLLPVHPEFCKLQKIELLKASYEWDSRFEETDTYAEAKQKGYLNPTNNSSSPFSYFNGSGNIDTDPLANLQAGIFKLQLEDILTGYKIPNDGLRYSMWGVAAIAAACPDTKNNACISKFRTGPALDTALSLCTADKNMAWRMFREFYLQAKKKIINTWLNTQCVAPTSLSLIQLGYQPRFASEKEMIEMGGGNLPADSIGVINERNRLQQQLNDLYDANCRAYVTNWLAQLSTCRLYDSASLHGIIIPELIAVCKEGADLQHTLGSSTVKPSSTYKYRSFEEVIDNFNRTKKITSPDCNAYVLTSPKPYDQQIAYNWKPVISKPDDCECELISNIHDKYKYVQESYESFSDYLYKTYQTRISDTTLSKLLGLCDGSYQCNFTEEALSLPPAFQCNTGNVCLDCDLFRKIDKSFRERYPEIYPTAELNSHDSVQRSWNKLYEQYFNSKTGFTKTVIEYLQFANQCDGSWRTPGCDSLNRALADFTKSRKASYGISYSVDPKTEIFRKPADIVRDGVLMVPDSIRSIITSDFTGYSNITNGGQKFCTEGGFTLEFRFKFLDLNYSGGALYVLAGGSGFTIVRHNYRFEYMGGSFKGVLVEAFGGIGDNLKAGFGNGSNMFSYLNVDTNVNVVFDWCVVKYKVTSSRYQVYFNGRLVLDLPRDPVFPIPGFNGFGISLRGRGGVVDWWKYYDANDQLKYFEDFNDVNNNATPAPGSYCPATVPDCRESFRTFFNTRFKSSFTSEQIEQLYYAKCGRALDVCGLKDSINATLERFNSIKPNKLMAFVHSTAQTAPDTLVTETRRVYRDGAFMWPAFLQTDPRSVEATHRLRTQSGSELCTAQGFSLEARIKLVADRQAAVADLFSFVNPGNIGYVISRDVQGLLLKEIWMDNAGVWQNVLPAPVVLNSNSGIIFSSWNDFKISFSADSVSFLFNGVRKITLNNPGVSGVSSTGFDFTFNSYQGSIDRIRIYDKSGKQVLLEEFSDYRVPAEFDPGFLCTTLPDCQNAFVSYFNSQRGTSFTFNQIDSLYHLLTGKSIDVCGVKDSLLNVIGRYNTTTNPYRLKAIQSTNNDPLFAGTPYNNHEEPAFGIGDGMFRWADTIKYAGGGTGWRNFVFAPGQGQFCTEQGYSIEARIHATRDLWGVAAQVFTLKDENCEMTFARGDYPLSTPGAGLNVDVLKYFNAVNTAVSFLPSKIRISDNPFLLSQEWITVKVTVSANRYKLYLNGILKCDLPHTYSPLKKVQSLILAFNSYYGAIDWIKMFDHKGKLQFHEDFQSRQSRALVNSDFICSGSNGDCVSSFVNYFNQLKGTAYSYERIDSLYHSVTGGYLDMCGGKAHPSNSIRLCGRAQEGFPVYDISAEDITNCSDTTNFIRMFSGERYRLFRDSILGRFDSAYRDKCLEAFRYENFTMRRQVSEYHYTLYYYDQAGNLVKTVPPSGVHPNYDSAWIQNVNVARATGQLMIPDHKLWTNYRYNTLNQVVAQHTPDGGSSKFWYDRLGRLVVSQNARQYHAASTEEDRQYSYTKYDSLGRITEVGQVKNIAGNGPLLDTISRNPALLKNWFASLNNRREQITTTVYDEIYEGFNLANGILRPVYQRNLRNRVSYTTYTDGWNTANYNNGTFYSYDIHGNVDTLLQDFGCGSCDVIAVQNLMNQNGNRFKKISYNYDLISGKVNSVAYQRGWSDQFFHRYSYDGENRLTLVETSLDGYFWEKDARYEYYPHGPLARTVLGHQQVQGIDYAYTLQGWLKGINSSGATDSFDIGGDGRQSSLNRYVARDTYGFALNYFGNDYKTIGTGVMPFPAFSAYLNADFRPLYNGNISSMINTNRIFCNPAIYPDSASLLFNYTYDQLNRITGMDVYNKFNREQNSFAQLTRMDKFKERVTYDPNGNILKYLRNGNGNGNPAHLRMDSLQYAYYPGTNRLRQVRDSVPASWYGAAAGDKIIDIDNQADEDNYLYDSIGNLIRDKAEGITNINWNVYGKITRISRGASPHVSASEIYYTYDAAGNRISKTVEKNGRKNITWYVRDAQGNVMSTYSADSTAVTPLSGFVLNADERYIYGSSRLGVVTVSTEVDNRNGGPERRLVDTGGVFKRGERIYELSNHLGNVLVTISDRKKGVADPLNAALIKFFEPVMLSGTDYYPFGMAMRVGGDNKYKYGFNGKENDNEVKGGDGLQQDYGMRVYDSRLGRFLSVDPLSASYPWNSPYSYAEGDPVNYVDIDGAEKGGNTAQATIALRTSSGPSLGNLGVDKNGNLVNRTQLFTTGGVNSGNYTAPSWLSNVDYSRYVPPYAQTASVVQNPHGVYVVGQTGNGTNYVNAVYEVPQKKEVTWVDRAIIGQQQERWNQLNSTTQWNTSIQAYEIITTDPSTLNHQYLEEVQRRLISGNATAQDKVYEKELRNRKMLYEINDKHNPTKPLGGANASLLPQNHLQLWESRSYYDSDTDTWWSMEGEGKKAVYHRFSSDGNGTYHWSGSTGENKNRKGKTVAPIPLNRTPVKEIKKSKQ